LTLAAAAVAVTGGCSNESSTAGDVSQLQQENEELRIALADAIAQRDSAELRARDSETRAAQAATPPVASASTAPAAGNSYIVRAGDTLSHIALRFYKDASRWPEIHEANMGLIGNDPARLKVGMKLTIPPQ
jgi:nucleoid-associated protein YgaU